MPWFTSCPASSPTPTDLASHPSHSGVKSSRLIHSSGAVIGAVCGECVMAALQDQAIRQHCKTLRMPTIGTQFARLAEAAVREGQSHVGYLEALLAAEMEERESRAITRLLNEAKLPRMKTLEAFEFDRSGVSA